MTDSPKHKDPWKVSPYLKGESKLTPFGWIQNLHWAWILWGVSALVLYARIYIGVDFWDESGYVSIPLSFLKGSRPFFDEITTTQNVGILTLPFLWLFNLVNPNLEGVVLFTRHLYLLFALFFSWSVYKFIKHYFLSTNLALFLSCWPLAFILVSTPNLSYNTLGFGCITIALFTFARIIDSKTPRLRDCILGVALVLIAVFSYPTLVLPGLAILAWIPFVSRERLSEEGHRRLFGVWLAGGVFGIIISIFLLFLLKDQIYNLIDYYRIFGTNFGGSEKLLMISNQFLHFRTYFVLFTTLWIFLFLSNKVFKQLFLISPFFNLLFIAVFTFFISQQPMNSDRSNLLLTAFGHLPWFLVCEKKFDRLNRTLLTLWIFLFICSLNFIWTSSNGLLNGSLGGFGLTLLNIAFMFDVEFTGDFAIGFRLRKLSRVLLSGFLFATTTASCFWYVYPGHTLGENTEVIESGPFRYLWTLPVHKELIHSLTSDLDKMRSIGGTIFFFNDFPGGHVLAVGLKKIGISVWIPSYEIVSNRKQRSEFVLGYFKYLGQNPNWAVYLKPLHKITNGTFDLSLEQKNDEVHQFFLKDSYHLFTESRLYRVYKRAEGYP